MSYETKSKNSNNHISDGVMDGFAWYGIFEVIFFIGEILTIAVRSVFGFIIGLLD